MNCMLVQGADDDRRRNGVEQKDCILIGNLHELIGYGYKRLMKEYPTKNWKKSTLNDFLKDVKTKSHDCIRPLLMKQPKNGQDVFLPVSE